MEGYLAVVNPAAGGGRCGKLHAEAIARLREAGVDVEVALTSAPGEAAALVEAAVADGRTRFIAVGGDGTGYEIVNGMFARDRGTRPQLGFLPLGTGNSFLRDFTTQGAEHSLQALRSGLARPCDVFRLSYVGGVLHFINLMSIGFVADVNGLRARRFKRWGELGYVAAVVMSVIGLRARSFPMSVDGGDTDDAPMVFASFNNSKFTGGKMMMAPQADTADGRIALVRVGPLGRIGLLRTFPKIFKGTHVHHPAVSQSQVERVEFFGDEEIDVMIDGEALRLVPRVLEVLPSAIDVAV